MKVRIQECLQVHAYLYRKTLKLLYIYIYIYVYIYICEEAQENGLIVSKNGI